MYSEKNKNKTKANQSKKNKSNNNNYSSKITFRFKSISKETLHEQNKNISLYHHTYIKPIIF